jgi:hypothetical protein
MATFKNIFVNDNQSMKKAESFIEPEVITKNNSAKNIFDDENTSEMIMEIIVWLTVVSLVFFSM